MKFIFSIIVLLVTTPSTCDSAKESVESKSPQTLESGSYDVMQLGEKNAEQFQLTITFDKETNRFSGFGGCNTYFGTYTLEGDNLSFGPIAASKKLCHGEIGSTENHFFKTLIKVETYTLKDNKLSLMADDKVIIEATKSVVENSARPIIMGNKAANGFNDKTYINYKVSSRNSFEYILLSQTEMQLSTDKYLKKIDSLPMAEKDWATLINLLDSIDTQNLDKLKAPTDKRLYDGAAHATLSVIKGDVEMMTPSFDHGNPPKEIEALVNKVLSIKENATKQ